MVSELKGCSITQGSDMFERNLLNFAQGLHTYSILLLLSSLSTVISEHFIVSGSLAYMYVRIEHTNICALLTVTRYGVVCLKFIA